MRARLVVFPIKGRNWCFSRSVDHSVSSASASASSQTPSSLKELWRNISSSSSSNATPFNAANAELLVDFVSLKMNKGWTSLEKAPQGTFKNKIHGLGLRLLARVKPSEIFFKSISKEITDVEVTYPSSLNARLVRQRLRHIAKRGTIIHRNYFYGSALLVPLTSVLMVLPLPNIAFFWTLFRTYSHWRALQGSEKLLQLVSDSSSTLNSTTGNEKETENDESKHVINNLRGYLWVLQPSKELEELIRRGHGDNGLSKCAISDICKTFDLNTNDVLKYRNSV